MEAKLRKPYESPTPVLDKMKADSSTRKQFAIKILAAMMSREEGPIQGYPNEFEEILMERYKRRVKRAIAIADELILQLNQ